MGDLMLTSIEEVKPGDWVDLHVKVVQLWDNEHESIRQVGILGDKTGIIKFVSWEKSNQPLLEEGAEYEITNLPVSEYGEYKQVSLNTTSEITRVSTPATQQSEIPTV